MVEVPGAALPVALSHDVELSRTDGVLRATGGDPYIVLDAFRGELPRFFRLRAAGPSLASPEFFLYHLPLERVNEPFHAPEATRVLYSARASE